MKKLTEYVVYLAAFAWTLAVLFGAYIAVWCLRGAAYLLFSFDTEYHYAFSPFIDKCLIVAFAVFCVFAVSYFVKCVISSYRDIFYILRNLKQRPSLSGS